MAVDVELFMKDEASQTSNQHLSRIVRDVYDNKLAILKLVEDLGPYLTDANVSQRCRAVQLLSGVLQRLVNYKLNQQQVEVLVSFYCDRLKDHYSIAPYTLYGLQALVVNQNVPGILVVKIVQAIFSEINTQSLMQSGRYTIYGILVAAINNNVKDLQAIGSDFVFGFIQAMDGEKDPRNLVMAFQIVTMLVKYFPIGLFAEDLFEVTSCYFPIDFNPPSDDPSGITKNDLVLGLRECLSSTSLFAPFCLPLLLEKLSSDIISAKIDSLLTLAMCMEVYSTEHIKDYLEPFWVSMKREIYQTVSSELEDAALQALQSIIGNLYTKQAETETKDNLMSTILQECHEDVSCEDLRKIKPNGRMLQAIASASEMAYFKVMSSTLPLLINKYGKQPAGVAKKITLDVILELLKVTKDFHSKDDPVMSFKDDLITIMLEAVTSESPAMNCAGITGLVTMVALNNVCSDHQVSLFVQHFTRHSLNSTDTAVRQESTMALAFLSSRCPQLIKTQLLPLVQSRLTSEENESMVCDSYSDTVNTDSHAYIMNTLSVVCTQDSLVRDILPIIVEHGQNLAQVSEVTSDIKSKGVKIFKSLLAVIEGTLKHKVVTPDYYGDALISQVLLLAANPAIQGLQKNLMFDPDILEAIGSVLRVISSQLQPESAKTILQSVIRMFVDGKLPTLLGKYTDCAFRPLEISSPWQQTQLVTLLMSVVCSVRQEVSIPKVEDLLAKLETLACQSTHRRTNIAAAKCLAGLINKMDQDDKVNNVLQHIMDSIWPCIMNTDYQQHHWSLLITWLWVTRSLIINSHPCSAEFIKKIISLFNHNALGTIASDGFYILIADSDDVMTTNMHANVKMMYRQRFFMETLPLLVAGFQCSPSGFKHNYLTAVAHLLRWIPKQVLMCEISNLMPLLIQSLSHDQTSLLQSSLQTVYSLVFDAPEAVIKQITSIIPNLLRLVKCQSSMNVRMEALKCLGAMTTLPHHVVYVYKPKVVKELASCLDDKKRLVRAAAVTCRNEWYLLGST